MKIALAAAALLTMAGPALAFDPNIEAVLNDLHPKVVLSAGNLMTLMQASERWCYVEENGTCGWAETYLDVTSTDIRLEMGYNYTFDDAYERYKVDQARFEDDRYVCQYDYNWVPSLRLIRRSDGVSLSGRELDGWRVQFANNFGIDDPDCYDYQFVRADEAARTVTLLQRTFSDFVKDEGSDVLVTLHFDAADAAALTFREPG